MWNESTAPHLIVGDHETVHGLTFAYQLDLLNRVVFFSCIRFPVRKSAVAFWEGVATYLTFLFDSLDLRKIYVEVLESNLFHFESLIGSLLIEEAHYRERVFSGGWYQDLFVFAIERDRWFGSALSQLGSRAPTSPTFRRAHERGS